VIWRRMVFLVSGSLAFWALLAYPAFRLGTVRALTDSAIACGLCLLPALLTLLLAYITMGRKPQDQLWIVLGGTGIRMGTVLGLGLLLSWLDPHFQQISFWAWVLVFYLFTLGLEVGLLMWRKSAVVARG
jgi:hypothetical protein